MDTTASHAQFTLPNRPVDETYTAGDPVLRVTVEGWNGRSISGALVDFQPSDAVLRIVPADQARALSLRFNQVKQLRIDHVGHAAMLGVAAGLGDEALHSFVVQLRDGSVYSGLCYEWRRTDQGLWIFPKKRLSNDPERVFIPNVGIVRYQIQRVDDEALANNQLSATLLADDAEIASEPLQRVEATTVKNFEQLKAALARQAALKPVRIGEALVGLGKITPEQLASALQRQKGQPHIPLGQMLIDMGLIAPADLRVALARKMGYPFVDVHHYPIDADALRAIPIMLATRLSVLPIALLEQSIVIAMSDPLQFKAIDELEFTAQRKVIPVVSAVVDLQQTIARAYRAVGLADDAVSVAAESAAADDAAAASAKAWQLAAELTDEEHLDHADEPALEQSDNTMVKLVNSMIVEAFHQRASDIHIEPYPGREKVVIRFRVDGEMRPYLELPASYRNALIARIKVMSALDISERRRPQDGKIYFRRFGGLPIELRVATIPTVNGLEDVVMRILNTTAALPLDGLQLSPRNLAALEQILERPYGLLLCVGPTGSGKTTTLHAALQRLNTPNRKIWTAEDPVEITQRGLRQIQVNPKIGWTFSNALRALLRADPDVIMVGEIRDAETAEMAIEASLTGHFVMSTLHTNSAAETIVRLGDLGVDPFSFADSLQGILAQRLVRRLCPACGERVPLQPERLRELMNDYRAQLPENHPLHDADTLERQWRAQFSHDGDLTIGQAHGCPECGHTGFRGRVALHELLVASPQVRHLVQSRGRSAQIQAQAIQEGMRTLRQDGIEKVLAGLTTLAEVRASSNL